METRSRIYPTPYFHQTQIHKPIDEIYADLDAYSGEFLGDPYFLDVAYQHNNIDFVVLLPPLMYDDRFIKGIFISQGVDWLYELFPSLSTFYHSVCEPFWCNYPWSKSADAYCVMYENPDRERWFKQNNPDRSSKILLPLHFADFTDEYAMGQVPGVKRDIDVLTVARLHDLKNLPFIAKAIKIYQKKYHKTLNWVIAPGKTFSANLEGLNSHEQEQVRAISHELQEINVQIVNSPVSHFDELPRLYSRSRVFAFGSLIEGKPRVLHEAMSCNTPVVVCKEFNQFSRGKSDIFPSNAGIYARFDPESYADAIHTVLKNYGDFSPRSAYLQNNGRKQFFNKVLDAIPYYKENLPLFCPVNNINNRWLDLAIYANYRISLFHFLYGYQSSLLWMRGLNTITDHLNSLPHILKKATI